MFITNIQWENQFYLHKTAHDGEWPRPNRSAEKVANIPYEATFSPVAFPCLPARFLRRSSKSKIQESTLNKTSANIETRSSETRAPVVHFHPPSTGRTRWCCPFWPDTVSAALPGSFPARGPARTVQPFAPWSVPPVFRSGALWREFLCSGVAAIHHRHCSSCFHFPPIQATQTTTTMILRCPPRRALPGPSGFAWGWIHWRIQTPRKDAFPGFVGVASYLLICISRVESFTKSRKTLHYKNTDFLQQAATLKIHVTLFVAITTK